MGAGFVLLIYLALLVVLAVPVAFWNGRRVSRTTRHLSLEQRRRWIIAGTLLPVICGCYLLFCMIAVAAFSLHKHHGFGFGDDFQVPLNNHYRIEAIDTTERGWIYNATIMDINASTHSRNAFGNVLQLQQQGDWIAGSYLRIPDPRSFSDTPTKPDSWFLFNTLTQVRIDASSESELRSIALAHGITLQLVSTSDFFAQDHFIWYQAALSIALLLPGIFGLFWLYKKFRRMRREAPPAEAVSA